MPWGACLCALDLRSLGGIGCDMEIDRALAGVAKNITNEVAVAPQISITRAHLATSRAMSSLSNPVVGY